MALIQTQRGILNISDHRSADCRQIPLILIHGAGGSRLTWPGEIRRMPCANTIAVDLPGHGKSHGTGRTSITDYAQDIVALMDTLYIPRAVLCGHSMGGAIAQTIALEHPDRTAGLVLVNTGAKLRIHPNLLALSQNDIEATASLLNKWAWSGDSAAGHRMAMQAQLNDLSPGVLHNDYLACDAFDVREQLGEINAPTLVIGGGDDHMTPLKFSRLLHENIPHTTLQIIEDGSHFTILENSRQVAAHIKTWLQQHHDLFTQAAKG